MARAEGQPGSEEGRDEAAENRRVTSFVDVVVVARVVVVAIILEPEEETEERAAVAMAATRALGMLFMSSLFFVGERRVSWREKRA